jgi:hypothetical protein
MTVGIPAWSAVPQPESWCGSNAPEISTLWQDALRELRTLETFTAADDLELIPGRVSTLLDTLVALHLATLRQSPEMAQPVWTTYLAFASRRAALDSTAKNRELSDYHKTLATIRKEFETLRRQFSPGLFRPVLLMLPERVEPAVAIQVKAPPLATDKPAEVQITLRDIHGAALGEEQLLETHTRKLHALVIDSALADYQHEHPVATGERGQFRMTFTPRNTGDYFLWLDLLPAATRRDESLRVILRGTNAALPAPVLSTQTEYVVEGMRFELQFDEPSVRSGQTIATRLRVSGENGRPFFALEPLMGAFAHVVGFLDDRQTYLHVHSLGSTPKAEQRGGPEVPFLFIVPRSGHLKMFVQTRVRGKILLSQFSFPVE